LWRSKPDLRCEDDKPTEQQGGADPLDQLPRRVEEESLLSVDLNQ
jgi:hypothetical protein